MAVVGSATFRHIHARARGLGDLAVEVNPLFPCEGRGEAHRHMWQDRISQLRDLGASLQSQGRRRRRRHSVFVMYWRSALHDAESQRIRAGAKGRGEAGSRKAGAKPGERGGTAAR